MIANEIDSVYPQNDAVCLRVYFGSFAAPA